MLLPNSFKYFISNNCVYNISNKELNLYFALSVFNENNENHSTSLYIKGLLQIL